MSLPSPYRSDGRRRSLAPARAPVDPRLLPIPRRVWNAWVYALGLVWGLTLVPFVFLDLARVSIAGVTLLYMVILLRLLWARRIAQRIGAQSEDAAALMRGGNRAEARARFERMALSVRWVPGLQSQLVANLGVAWLGLGDAGRAAQLLEATLLSGWLPRGALRASVAAHLATAEVSLGELGAAERWLGEARRSTSPERKGSLLLVDVIFKVGSGESRQALEQIAREWPVAEAQLGPGQIRTLRSLIDLAVREGASAARLPEELREGRRASVEELECLAGRWPELAPAVPAPDAPRVQGAPGPALPPADGG